MTFTSRASAVVRSILPRPVPAGAYTTHHSLGRSLGPLVICPGHVSERSCGLLAGGGAGGLREVDLSPLAATPQRALTDARRHVADGTALYFGLPDTMPVPHSMRTAVALIKRGMILTWVRPAEPRSDAEGEFAVGGRTRPRGGWSARTSWCPQAQVLQDCVTCRDDPSRPQSRESAHGRGRALSHT